MPSPRWRKSGFSLLAGILLVLFVSLHYGIAQSSQPPGSLQPGNIATVAGNGTAGYAGDNSAAIDSSLNQPSGVTIDAAGNIYIADMANSRIRVVNVSATNTLTIAGVSIAPGDIGTVAGTGVAGYDQDGVAAASAELNGPAGVALDPMGNIYIADTANSRIRVVNASATNTLTIAGVSIAPGNIGTVAGTGVAGYDQDGVAAASAELNGPAGVALDALGNIYIADTANSRIRVVNASATNTLTIAGVRIAPGNIGTVAGTGVAGYDQDGVAATAAELNSPSGVAVDGSGDIYIADTQNQRLREVNGNGTISTIGGTGDAGYTGDGIPAITAGLAEPASIALDGARNIYVADRDNERIREVGAIAVSTTAGFLISAPASTTPGTAFTLTVTALDQNGNTAVGYAGTIQFSSTDQAALLPNNVNLTHGTGTFSATLNTAGNQTITASDSVTSSITGTSAPIHVNLAPAITSLASTTLTAGTAGSFTVTTTGYPAPALSEMGTLPTGLSFADNGNGTGTLQGMPATGSGGPYSIAFTASNGILPNATQTFTLTVDQAPMITSASGTTFTAGVPGSFRVTATGYPAPTLGETGALPSGLTFDASTGVLSGTPAPGTGGVYSSLLFTASNSSGTASQPLTLTVIQLPPATVVATAGTPQSALINTAFATPFQVTVWDANSQPVAGATVNFAVPSSGPGGSFAGGVTTAVANTLGVATAPVFTANGTVGLYTINASVAGVATPATFSLTNTQPPFFTSAANATFAVGAQQLFPATASGFPAPAVSLASGSLPSGLVFNGGVLSGIPAPGTGGIYTLTLAATNGILPNASQTFTLMVDQGSAFTSANSATFTAGAPSSFTFTVSGFPSPAISLASGTLPNGVGFSNGALSGTPAAGTGGQYSLTLSASNGIGGAALQNFTLVVDQAPAITSTNSATFTTGVPGSFLMTATGFPAPALGEVGTLPSGLAFNANTGVLSGTPAPDSGGSYQITLSASSGPFAPVTQTFTLIVNLAVLTQHNDNTRSGLNSSERLLTTLNVNASQFGKVFALPVDGQVYGQPLYVANVQFPGNVIHNVLIVTTENDSVYAFDADSNSGANANPLWKANLVDSGHGGGVGEAPVDTAVQNGCTDLTPQVGVTATPVIDLTTAPAPTIYVEAASVLGVNYLHKIHALDITSGNEKSQGPTLISGTVPGTGDGSSDGNLSFSPASERNRSGLLLLNGVIYVAFGSYCDYTPYQGWLFAYDATSLAQRSLFVTTPNGGLGGIWAGGTGLAADQNGFLYIPTGNGTFDTTTPVTDFGDSILKFSTINNNQSNGFLSLTDYFTPYDQAFMWQNDQDLGSGGVLLLPDQPGAHPHLLVQAGKRGKVYLLDRDQMTSNPLNPLQTEPYCSACTSADTQILQESSTSYLGPVFAGPSYWNNNIYFWGVKDALTSIPLSNGLLNFSGAAKASLVSGFPGTAISISSNGDNSGTAIVWANAVSGVYAYNAENVSQLLWSSNEAPNSRDAPGPHTAFSTPTVVNGKVYVGSGTEVDVYGQLTPVNPATVTLSLGETQQFTTVLPGPVTWSISPVLGTISAAGFYTAPASIASAQTVTVTVTNGISTGSAVVTVIPSVALASFIQADTTTQGNWVGAYGIDGYSLANVAVATIPSYAVLAVQNASSYTWAQTSFDPRALQMPGGSQRMAATWYNAPSFAFDVNLTDGHPHQVAVYALDWDSKGRVENVQVLDANSGFLLNSQTISNFTGGVYLVWTITGHVQIVVNTLGGPNSVISGIFFGAGTSLSPLLSITKTHPGAFAQGQQNAAYTLTVSNTVNAAATSGTVVVTETPPLGLTVASMAGAGWTCPSGANNCTRSDPLAGGSSYPPITALVNVSTTASNPQVNQASVTGGGSATASANDSTVIVGSGSATASFVAQDTTTSGNWQGVYGADGSCLANVAPQSPPGYASFAVLNPQSYTWTPATTDPRALQISGSTQRIAAAWYSGASVTLDVNLTDGRQHQVVVYALDWDSRGRAETLQVLDANSGILLSSQTVSNFSSGVYVVWNISGHVQIVADPLQGPNAVVSAVFWGGAGAGTASSGIESVSVSPQQASLVAGGTTQFSATISNATSQTVTWSVVSVSPSGSPAGNFSTTTAGLYLSPATLTQAETVTVMATSADGTASGTAAVNLTPASSGSGGSPGSTAAFVTSDTATQGNWQGTYGSGGYDLAGGSQSPAGGQLSYGTYAVKNGQIWTWAPSTTDKRALATDALGDRMAATWYAPSFSFDVNFTDGNTHQVAIYVVDWDSKGRQETVQIVDANNPGTTLDTRGIASSNTNTTETNFVNGTYLIWNISGHVTMTITSTAGPNAVVSGIFFGNAAPAGPNITSASSATFTVGQPGNFTVTASGSPTPTLMEGGTLPGGVTFTDNGNGTATLSGTPAANTAGSYSMVLTASNSVSTATQNFTLVVNSQPTAPATAATFVSADTATQGNWQGTYGSGGYDLAGGSQSPAGGQLSYGTYAVKNGQIWTWAPSTTDKRALATDALGDRMAATWYAASFGFDVNFTDGNTHQVAIYVVDWDSKGRQETVQIVDANNPGTTLDTRGIASSNTNTTETNFVNGTYLIWNISGHVTMTITSTAGPNAVVSGIFFK